MEIKLSSSAQSHCSAEIQIWEVKAPIFLQVEAGLYKCNSATLCKWCASGLRYAKYQQIQREGPPTFCWFATNHTLGSPAHFRITLQPQKWGSLFRLAVVCSASSSSVTPHQKKKRYCDFLQTNKPSHPHLFSSNRAYNSPLWAALWKQHHFLLWGRQLWGACSLQRHRSLSSRRHWTELYGNVRGAPARILSPFQPAASSTSNQLRSGLRRDPYQTMQTILMSLSAGAHCRRC